MTDLSVIEAEKETEAARDRLTSTMQQLQENLSPRRLMSEMTERVGGPQHEGIVSKLEGTIRSHPLPMMLIGMGAAMCLSSAWERKGPRPPAAGTIEGGLKLQDGAEGVPPATPAELAASLKEEVAAVGQSVADRAYEVLRSRASAKIDQYTKAATESIEAVSDEILDAVEQAVDGTAGRVAEVVRARPMTFSLIAILLGTALGGLGSRNAGSTVRSQRSS